MTHEQFLDEPGDIIAWMLHIDFLQRAYEAEQRSEAERG